DIQTTFTGEANIRFTCDLLMFCHSGLLEPENAGMMKKAGYVSATDMVLHDKLAVAYGILKIPPGRPIRKEKTLIELLITNLSVINHTTTISVAMFLGMILQHFSIQIC
ncbi:hypothetical protein ACJX0J_031064, partial [Zea mays]